MKKILRYTLTVLVVMAVIMLGAGYYMLGYALQPRELETRSHDIAGSYKYIYKEYPELRPWIDSLQAADALQHHYLENEENQRMHALYVRASRPTKHTAIIIHGYTDNAVRMLPIGYMYSKILGFNILLPDLHAHGESEGKAIRMGWLDRQDVAQWITQTHKLFGDSIEIVVHGISMGAATTMMLSGEELPTYVKCFVEDCGYTSVWDEFEGELKNQFGVPAFPLLNIASRLCEWKYNWGFHEASALKQVRKCTRPMFFIHGDKDNFVPTWMVYPLYEVKSQPKELWLVSGATHAVSYKENKQEYTRRVKDFVGKCIH